jgi:hypothetical protein
MKDSYSLSSRIGKINACTSLKISSLASLWPSLSLGALGVQYHIILKPKVFICSIYVHSIIVSFSLCVALISSTVLRTSKFVTYFICLQSHLVFSLLWHDSFDPVSSVLILHMIPHQIHF